MIHNRKTFKYFKIFRLYLDSEEYTYRRDSPLGTSKERKSACEIEVYLI